jgi:hypothetical protein
MLIAVINKKYLLNIIPVLTSKRSHLTDKITKNIHGYKTLQKEPKAR